MEEDELAQQLLNAAMEMNAEITTRRVHDPDVRLIASVGKVNIPMADGIIRRLLSTGKIEETFFNPSQDFHRYRVI